MINPYIRILKKSEISIFDMSTMANVTTVQNIKLFFFLVHASIFDKIQMRYWECNKSLNNMLGNHICNTDQIGTLVVSKFLSLYSYLRDKCSTFGKHWEDHRHVYNFYWNNDSIFIITIILISQPFAHLPVMNHDANMAPITITTSIVLVFNKINI